MWIAGRGRYPPELATEELRWAEWERPAKSTPAELLLSAQIAERLVKTKQFRYLAAADMANPRSLEHPIRDLAGAGRVDILLVDLRRMSPTLLGVEVKLRASLAPANNPIPQITRYHAALVDRYSPCWAVETLIVAEHFGDAVIREAAQKGIRYVYTDRSGRLKEQI